MKFTAEEQQMIRERKKAMTDWLDANGFSTASGATVTRIDFESVFPNLTKRRKRMVAEWGERCDEHEDGCPTCEAWKLWDFLPGEVPPIEEVMACMAAHDEPPAADLGIGSGPL